MQKLPKKLGKHMFLICFYIVALFHKVFGCFRFYGLIWEFLALFHRVLGFQVFSVAHVKNSQFPSPEHENMEKK